MDWLTYSIKQLKAHFRNVSVAMPADMRDIAGLHARFARIPDDLQHFYSNCNGITISLRDDTVGNILPLKMSLQFMPIASGNEPANRFLPVRCDGCGDYDCVVLGDGLAEGSVVFWDHEVYDGPAYLLAGSFRNYLEMWTDYLLTRYRPDGEEDSRYVAPSLTQWPWVGKPELQHPWPFDESWMKARDANAERILDNPGTRAWLLKQG